MDAIHIQNFKCFSEIRIPTNRLTILAGSNGKGKSTVIQALLYLRRTIEHCAKWDNDRYIYSETNGLKVQLNGAYRLALGHSSSIINRVRNEEKCTIGIEESKEQFRVQYSIGSSQLWLEPTTVEGGVTLNNCGIFKQQFYYLNAERVGPRISQAIQFYDYPNTGYQGEFVAQLLGDTEFSYSFKVDDKRKFEELQTPRLEQQLNAWLDYIIPGVSISAKYDTETGSAQIRMENEYTKGDSILSTNIGFGISYVLPIIVTGLIAENDSYMVIENPEAHLHPSAQSKIGRFLASVASAGINVIIETHSEHVLNGVQIAAAKSVIPADLVNINFFEQKIGSIQPDVVPVSLNELGELSRWPNGFFDQSQIDFAELHEARKK